MEAPKSFDVYLSFVRENRVHADRIGSELSAQGYEVFWDLEIEVGSEPKEEVMDAIARSRTILILIAQDELSLWQEKEVQYGLQLKLSPVIVMLPGAEPARLPDSLREFKWLDFREGELSRDRVGELLSSVGALLRGQKKDGEFVEQKSLEVKWKELIRESANEAKMRWLSFLEKLRKQGAEQKRSKLNLKQRVEVVITMAWFAAALTGIAAVWGAIRVVRHDQDEGANMPGVKPDEIIREDKSLEDTVSRSVEISSSVPNGVRVKIRRLISGQLGLNLSKVQPTSSLIQDLGADSLDVVEIVMALEETFKVEIPDEDIVGTKAGLESSALKALKVSDLEALIVRRTRESSKK